MIRAFAGACLAVAALTATALGQSRTYTTDADFDLGTIVNLNHNPPFNNQLQLNPTAEPFPFISVACSGRGTIVRLETNTGQVLGEYLSSPDGMARNPSRTTVDLYGNVWCGNRDENGADGMTGSAIKIGIIIGGVRGNKLPSGEFVPDLNGEYLQPPFAYSTCVDRDGDGLIRTSKGLGNTLAWSNAGGADSNGGVSTAEDEAIIVYARTPGAPGVRHVSVDRDNNVWIGGFRDYVPRSFVKVNGDTGTVMTSFNAAARFGCGGYGGFVDRNGILWSASLNQFALLRYDPATDTGAAIGLGRQTYGLGADSDGNVWNSNWEWNTVTKLDAAGVVYPGFPVGLSASGGRGVVSTPLDNNVWIACSHSNLVDRFASDGTLLKQIGVGAHPTGVAVDRAGKVWVTNYNSSDVMRIDPAAGPDGLGAVDLVVPLGGNAYPYNYSDMTGVIAVGITSQQGSWDVVFDSQVPALDWGKVTWDGATPAGTAITVGVRAADTVAGLTGVPFTFITKDDPFNGTGVNGRYIELRTTLSREAGVTETPVLYELSVQAPLDAELDISPGLSANKVVLGKPYTVYAVLFGSAQVDVRSIIPGSVRFGASGTEAAPVRQGIAIDFDRDGFEDVLYGFRTTQCGLTTGTGIAWLRASLTGDIRVQAWDNVLVVP
ncbi:hypothetical protein PHYC_03009 [Phycisphaerales bacterium]|nr:hypothetical protein PHYC_03009 [Phycisphaerales bacterium]